MTDGQKLKEAIKRAGYTETLFAQKMGYKDRGSLIYQLRKENLAKDKRERAAKVLGISVNDLFGPDSDPGRQNEIEHLNRLIESQKELITTQRELIESLKRKLKRSN